MKKFLYTIIACFLIPVVFIGAAIYVILYVLQLLFRTILLQFDKGMTWIDKNITQNIK